MTVITSLEAKETPLACTEYDLLEDLCAYLRAGTSKSSFGEDTDRLLRMFTAEKKDETHQVISSCFLSLSN